MHSLVKLEPTIQVFVSGAIESTNSDERQKIHVASVVCHITGCDCGLEQPQTQGNVFINGKQPKFEQILIN
jgi:hypothetical protein